MTPLDIALDYLARGWNPVPVEFGSKKPVGLAWQTRTLTAETASQYFNGAALNVGVVLGPSSQGLTDVDLDCPEAIIIAPYVLPPTSARFGRGSKRDSHYLFVTDLAGHCDKAVLTFRAGATMLVELRIGGAAGAQTVFPGSMHESGQAIIWEEDGKPAEVEGATLRQRVALLASCCLVARSWPKEGARHECALALGGSLSRAGLTPADIRRVAEAIGQAAGDPEAYDRGNAAHDAAEAHTKGERAYGFPRLAELISPEAAKQVADWLEYTGDESALGESRPRQVDLLIDLTKKAVLFTIPRVPHTQTLKSTAIGKLGLWSQRDSGAGCCDLITKSTNVCQTPTRWPTRWHWSRPRRHSMAQNNRYGSGLAITMTNFIWTSAMTLGAPLRSIPMAGASPIAPRSVLPDGLACYRCRFRNGGGRSKLCAT
jgi:Bifunctional DNA primase/polymerase, N-terminal